MSNKINILQSFIAKARCSYTQHKAFLLWKELEPHLTKEEKQELSVAWGHFKDYPWTAEELDYMSVKLREKWK